MIKFTSYSSMVLAGKKLQYSLYQLNIACDRLLNFNIYSYTAISSKVVLLKAQIMDYERARDDGL